MPEFEPLIPSSLWLALLLGATALTIWYAWRKPSAISRRRWASAIALASSAMALVLIVLLNPTWVRRIPPPPGKPLLTILVDQTQSMATPDGPNGQSRYAAACATASRVASALGNDFEIRTRAFDENEKSANISDLAATRPD